MITVTIDLEPTYISIEGNHEDRPIYLVLKPILDHCLDGLDALISDDGADHTDEIELSTALSMLGDFLNSRDTTVRETY